MEKNGSSAPVSMDDAGAAVFVQRREKEMRCMENDCAVTEQVREPLRFAESNLFSLYITSIIPFGNYNIIIKKLCQAALKA